MRQHGKNIELARSSEDDPEESMARVWVITPSVFVEDSLLWSCEEGG